MEIIFRLSFFFFFREYLTQNIWQNFYRTLFYRFGNGLHFCWKWKISTHLFSCMRQIILNIDRLLMLIQSISLNRIFSKEGKVNKLFWSHELYVFLCEWKCRWEAFTDDSKSSYRHMNSNENVFKKI